MTRSSHRTLLLPAAALLLIFLIETAAVKNSIQNALRLSYLAIIPSVFPFSVLSGYIMGQIGKTKEPRILRPITHFFCLPSGGATCFILGLLCGFPLGARCVADGYRNGVFTKKEAERLLLFCNNTGPAFLVGAIGGLRGNPRDGWILFGIQLFLACVVALVTRKKTSQRNTPIHTANSITFVQAVSAAVSATLTVVGFVLFFASCIGVVAQFLPTRLLLIIACLLEVSTAAQLASEISFGLALTAFAVCFSGLSVHLQSAALLADTDLSLGRYFIIKLLLGITAAALALPFCY